MNYIAVALSGGVDSATAALVLQQKGEKLIGLTMQTGAMSAEMLEKAARLADALGMEHHIVDLAEAFREKVKDVFFRTYAQGLTPSPCLICNREIKLGLLLREAERLGAAFLATGHYARRIDGPDGAELQRARNAAKDQSYFLAQVPKEALEKVLFPLGDFASKDEVRKLAEARGLYFPEQKESQDVCFIPQGLALADYLKRNMPCHAGEIVSEDGRVLGRHEGYEHYTVGQRRGLGVSAKEPQYVLAVDPESARVIVGPHGRLAASSVPIMGMNWLLPAPPPDGTAVHVKCRARQIPLPARIYAKENGLWIAELESPLYGLAPGQAAALYAADRLIGGGTITI